MCVGGCLQRPEEDIESLEVAVTEVCKVLQCRVEFQILVLMIEE